MKRIRQLHLHLGLFLAPTIIFFAFSGALQIFRLQESEPGSSYQPPAWAVALAGVHKDQRIEGPPKPRPAASTSAEAPPKPRPESAPEGPPPKKRSTPLMFFFLLTAIAMITTAVLGIIMAFKYNRDRRVIWVLLVLGAVLPVLFLVL